jgi:hypothetical protein
MKRAKAPPKLHVSADPKTSAMPRRRCAGFIPVMADAVIAGASSDSNHFSDEYTCQDAPAG